MKDLRAREPVILAENHSDLVEWYKTVLGFKVTYRVDDEYHYCNLENAAGIRIGIGVAKEMGITPGDRTNNTIVFQFQAENVTAFLAHIKKHGGAVTLGPTFDRTDKFWFGGFQDVEGNPLWVVDKNCPGN